MGDESTHSFQKKNSSTLQQTNQFGSRPFAAPVQMKPKEQQTPEELENEAFNQNKFEAFGLQLKENTGTITPVEQKRLGVLQAKMDDFWAQRLEKASRSGFDFSKVSVTPSESAAPQLQPMGRLGTQGESMGGQRSHLNSPQQSSASPIQAKLTIGEPGDQYEQEADRVASQVVEQIHAPATAQSTQGQSVQRQEEEKEEELQAKPEISALQRMEEPKEEDIQAKSIQKRGAAIGGGEATTDLESAINTAKGSGQPLDAGLQRSMGQAMGADFSEVKVHTDAQSDQLNQSIQAKAFTTGQDVFFRQGEYNPGSRGGQELIAHELTHVMQQNGGKAIQRVQNTTQEEARIEAARNTPAPTRDNVMMAFLANRGLNSESTPAEVFTQIIEYTRGGTYMGTASTLQQGLGANAWNCESLSKFMVEACKAAGQVSPSQTKRDFNPITGTRGTVGALLPSDFKIIPEATRRVSKVNIKPNMSCFRQGNVITVSQEGMDMAERRISFESHTIAEVAGVKYDPLMGVSGNVQDIWEAEVGTNMRVTINGRNYKYDKSPTEKEGPLSIARLRLQPE